MLISNISQLSRIKLTISGIVQGVGFRPYVYGLAKAHELVGFARNLGGKLQIEIEGPGDKVNQFIDELIAKAPPLACVKEFHCQTLSIKNEEKDFRILPSVANNDDWHLVPPDSATCLQCLHELFDENDRRYHYPFINCVNCGPRFTVINDLPYDRQYTTMSRFKMCDYCLQEYENPLSRRFHAQPNACAKCGPKLTLVNSDHSDFMTGSDAENIIETIATRLRNGNIIAVKGLGGFHLACDATNKSAVNNLRERKQRAIKPFAVMMSNLSMIKQYCLVSCQEEELLSSRAAPIVLLRTLPDCQIADTIAPGNYLLGVMLPYTPLHHLITSSFGKPLIMTSGNISEEPIAIDNEEALQALGNIADCFLLNDREVAARYDDSISRLSINAPIVIRRSRGYAPEPIELACQTKTTLLSFGAQLKNTFCFLKANQALISPHIGDLANIKAIGYFENTLKKYRQLFRLKEELLACDMHPDYLSSRLAETLAKKENLSVIRIQHHHAHIVSCMAEHKLLGPVIGIALDGSGYGPDGTIWGGEFLVAQLNHFRRFACLEPVRMPGGGQAIRHPWRMALGHIFDQKEIDQSVFENYKKELKTKIGVEAINLVSQQIEKEFNSPLTSSCGRLFDAISSILGICHQATYEGQAAIELEAAAILEERAPRSQTGIYQYSITDNTNSASPNHSVNSIHVLTNNSAQSQFQANYHISIKDMLNQIAQDKASGVEISYVARKFHYTLAEIIADLCCRMRCEESINNVCLSGGVFQNYLLLQDTVKILQSKDFSVFWPQQIPANDGGISLGQAVIAAAQTGNLNW